MIKRNFDAPAMPILPVFAICYKESARIELHYYFQNFDFDHEDPAQELNFLIAGVALTMAVKGGGCQQESKRLSPEVTILDAGIIRETTTLARDLAHWVNQVRQPTVARRE
jgi:hypothetical protein